MFEGKLIALTRVGQNDISTVEMPRGHWETLVRYQTCIFYQGGSVSNFLECYTEKEALAKHNWLVEHEQNHLRLSKRMQELDPKSKGRSL